MQYAVTRIKTAVEVTTLPIHLLCPWLNLPYNMSISTLTLGIYLGGHGMLKALVTFGANGC